jgi:hypothetical protein
MVLRRPHRDISTAKIRYFVESLSSVFASPMMAKSMGIARVRSRSRCNIHLQFLECKLGGIWSYNMQSTMHQLVLFSSSSSNGEILTRASEAGFLPARRLVFARATFQGRGLSLLDLAIFGTT